MHRPHSRNDRTPPLIDCCIMANGGALCWAKVECWCWRQTDTWTDWHRYRLKFLPTMWSGLIKWNSALFFFCFSTGAINIAISFIDRSLIASPNYRLSSRADANYTDLNNAPALSLIVADITDHSHVYDDGPYHALLCALQFIPTWCNISARESSLLAQFCWSGSRRRDPTSPNTK